jgi:hypothetical protein
MARPVMNLFARFQRTSRSLMVPAAMAILVGCTTTTSSTPTLVAFSLPANPTAVRAYAAPTN